MRKREDMSDAIEASRELIKVWRAKANSCYRACADELEVALDKAIKGTQKCICCKQPHGQKHVIGCYLDPRKI